MAFNKLPVEIIEKIFQYLNLSPRQIFLFSSLSQNIKKALSSFSLIFRTKDYFTTSNIHYSKQFKEFEDFVRKHPAKKFWIFTKHGEIKNFKSYITERKCNCLMIGAGGHSWERTSGKSGEIKFFKIPTPNYIWAKPGRTKEKDHPSQRGGTSIVKFKSYNKTSIFKVDGGLFGVCAASRQGNQDFYPEWVEESGFPSWQERENKMKIDCPEILELGLSFSEQKVGLCINEQKPKIPCLGNVNCFGFGAGGKLYPDSNPANTCEQCKTSVMRGRNGLIIVFV